MSLPQHIAIICDGNRRWAKHHKKPEFAGHRFAVENTMETLIDHCLRLKIPYLTFWIFSTENWQRGQTWVKKYFQLLRGLLQKHLEKYNQKQVKLNLIGDLSKLPSDIQTILQDWQQKTQNNKKITLTIAINYGGREEIIRAINQLPHNKPITQKQFSKYLDTKDLPDPDLLIRTGENNTRLSGFMLWQLAYTQLYFTNTLFPDFTPEKLDQAIDWYQTQTQNLGK